MSVAVQQMAFDYAFLDSDTRVFVQAEEQFFTGRLKRTASDCIDIGQSLLRIQKKLRESNNGEDGLFLSWLEARWPLSQRLAFSYMQWAERFGGMEIAKIATTSSVFTELLNSDETIIEMVESGQISPTLPAIREAKRETHEEATPKPSLVSQIVEAYGSEALSLPSGFGLADGQPFIMPLPDGKPVEVPDSWKLPPALQEGGSTVRPPVEIDRGVHDEHPLPIAGRGVPAALQMSESNEWFTPAQYVEAARELMGGIDVDPASNEYANNKVVHATTYYDIETNGLDKQWHGRVWLNPPYGRDNGDSNQEIWSRRLIEQVEAGITKEAVLLVNAVTDRKWFQPLWKYFICFTDHRIRFYNTEIEAGQPTHGNVLVYFAPMHVLESKHERFLELFSKFGWIVRGERKF